MSNAASGSEEETKFKVHNTDRKHLNQTNATAKPSQEEDFHHQDQPHPQTKNAKLNAPGVGLNTKHNLTMTYSFNAFADNNFLFCCVKVIIFSFFIKIINKSRRNAVCSCETLRFIETSLLKVDLMNSRTSLNFGSGFKIRIQSIKGTVERFTLFFFS